MSILIYCTALECSSRNSLCCHHSLKAQVGRNLKTIQIPSLLVYICKLCYCFISVHILFVLPILLLDTIRCLCIIFRATSFISARLVWSITVVETAKSEPTADLTLIDIQICTICRQHRLIRNTANMSAFPYEIQRLKLRFFFSL